MSQPVQPQPRRVQIINKDVQHLFDCSQATAFRKIREVKDSLGKASNQVVTIEEFCEHYGLEFSTVLNQLNLLV